MPDETTGLLSLKRAAAFLGIAPVTLRLWTYSGKVGFVRLGRRKLFNPDELARVVRANTVPAHENLSTRRSAPATQRSRDDA